MKFPNAKKGITKIFVAEILSLISSVCLAFMTIFGLLALELSNDVMLMITGAIAVVAFAIILISYIFNIIGVGQASKDEYLFKVAFFATIFGIVFALLSGFLNNAFQNNEAVTRFIGIVPDFLNLIIMVSSIMGIRNLATQLNDPVMEGKGDNIITLLCVMGIVIFVARTVAVIIPSAAAFAVFLITFAGILSIVTYVLYLIYLAKAKKMLAQ